VLLLCGIAPLTVSTVGAIAVGNAAELAFALSSAVDGDIIQLTADIDYSDDIVIGGKSITFDLNGKTLNSTGALYVSDGSDLLYNGPPPVNEGGKLLLADPGNGEFNISVDTYKQFVVSATNGSKLEITNVSVSSDYNVALWARHGEIVVYGDVAHTALNGPIVASHGSKITVNGFLTVTRALEYISVEASHKTQAQYESVSSKPGHREYKGEYTYTEGEDDIETSYTSYVWVKMPPTFAVSVSGGTGGGNYLIGAVVAIVATMPSGKVFDKWTATGVTLANPGNVSTSYIMPDNAVAVTATYKNVPATPFWSSWPSPMQWILKYILFGGLWMRWF